MAAYRLSNGLVDRMTIISEAAAERFIRERIIPGDLLRVIPNGVDPELYRQPPEVRDHLRRALGLGEEFVWLAVGRFETAKDYPNMLRAFASVRERHPEAVLLLAGRGALQGETESLARELEVGPAVRFLGVRDDVAALVSAADGSLMSSAWEGMPMVLLEAAAGGLPIVTTRAGGTAEVVLDGESGYLAPPSDSAALAAAMLRLMNLSEAQRRALGERTGSRLGRITASTGWWSDGRNCTARWWQKRRPGVKAGRLEFPFLRAGQHTAHDALEHRRAVRVCIPTRREHIHPARKPQSANGARLRPCEPPLPLGILERAVEKVGRMNEVLAQGLRNRGELPADPGHFDKEQQVLEVGHQGIPSDLGPGLPTKGHERIRERDPFGHCRDDRIVAIGGHAHIAFATVFVHQDVVAAQDPYLRVSVEVLHLQAQPLGIAAVIEVLAGDVLTPSLGDPVIGRYRYPPGGPAGLFVCGSPGVAAHAGYRVSDPVIRHRQESTRSFSRTSARGCRG